MQLQSGYLVITCIKKGYISKTAGGHGDSDQGTTGSYLFLEFVGGDDHARVRVCSSNDGKVWNKILCPHSLCFGSDFDVILLMYLVSSGFSFKPNTSSIIYS